MTFMTKTASDIHEISDVVTSRVDQASSSVHRAIDNASNAARPAVDNLSASAHHAVDRIAGAANQAVETLDAKSGQLRSAQSRITENCCAHVRDKPLTSLGLAVATGFLLSWLLKLR